MPNRKSPTPPEKESAVPRGTIRIGVSGWRYEPWRGVFYPPGLRQDDELTHASSLLNSIEINGTFYSLQSPKSFASWAADVPPDFIFAVKGPRFITHIRRLKNAKEPLANFFASGILRLGRALGPILWQLPPNFKFDRERLESFLTLLPRDSEAMAKLAHAHSSKLKKRAWLKPLTHAPIDHAMEIRHASFATPEFIDLLRQQNVALVCADSPQWPRLMDITADFIYCRLHGAEELYASGYDEKSLQEWAKRTVAWSRGENPNDAKLAGKLPRGKQSRRDVFIYFDNDAKVLAPRDAQRLRQLVAKLQSKDELQ